MRAVLVAATALILALPASAAAPLVSISAQPSVVDATDMVHLFGRVTTNRPGEDVQIESSECNGYGWRVVDHAETTSLGAWESGMDATTTTSFRARWKKSLSSTVTVRVQPFILLDTHKHRRLLVVVRASDYFKRALLERRSGARWVRVRSFALGHSWQGSAADLHLSLARGTQIRVRLTKQQVGRCYLATASDPSTVS